MDLKKLEQAKVLAACIDVSQKNIAHIEKIKAENEILIVPNSGKIKEAIKGILFGEEDIPPVYFSHRTKNNMLDVAIKEQTDYLIQREKEFKEL